MNENRETKELGFGDTSDSVKDINLSKNDVDSNEVNVSETKENTLDNSKDLTDDYIDVDSKENVTTDVKKENDQTSEIANSMFDDKQDINKKESGYLQTKNESEKADKNKRIWIRLIIVFVVLLILAGIIVGSLAIAGVFDKESDSMGPNTEQIDDWAESMETQNTKIENTINVLSDRAIIYYFDLLGGQEKLSGVANPEDFKDEQYSDARNQVDREQEDMKSTEGKDWEEAWDKNLVSMGFSTAENGGTDQYIDSIVSANLSSEIVDTFTGSGKLTNATISTSDNSGHSYTSSQKTETNQIYYVLPNADDVALNSQLVDIESLFTLYLNIKKPFVYEDILLPFTIVDYDLTHFFVNSNVGSNIDLESVTFASNSDIQKIWLVMTEIANGSFNFDDANYGATSSGIQHFTEISALSTSSEGETEETTSTYSNNVVLDGEDGSTDGTTDGTTEGTTEEDTGFNEMELAIIHSLLVNENNIEDLTTFQGEITDVMTLIEGVDGLNETINLNDISNWTASQAEEFSSLFNNAFYATFISQQTPSRIVDMNDYYLMVSLQSDGIHLTKFDGFSYGDGFSYDYYTVGQEIFKHDADISHKTTGIGNDHTESIYEVWEDYTEFVQGNISLLLLNQAYLDGVSLNVNESYEWQDVISTNLETDVEQGKVTLEQYVYGRPAYGMFMNYSKTRTDYIDYVNEFDWKLTTADLTPGGSEYDKLRNLLIYSETEFTYNGSDLNESWNYFMINYKIGGSVENGFGAINVQGNSAKIKSKENESKQG